MMFDAGWVWPEYGAHASRGPEVLNVTPRVDGVSSQPSTMVVDSMTSSEFSSNDDGGGGRRLATTLPSTMKSHAGSSRSSSSLGSQTNSSCRTCPSVRVLGDVDVARVVRVEPPPVPQPVARRPIRLQRPEPLFMVNSPVVCPVCSPTTAVWVPAAISTHVSATTASNAPPPLHRTTVVSSAHSSRIATSEVMTTSSIPTNVGQPIRRRCEHNDDGSRPYEDDVWNDDENDDDEAKLTDRGVSESQEDWIADRHAPRRKSAASDEKESTPGDEVNNGGGWHEVVDVVARQDDWMTCSTVFAVHLAYDGLRFAAMTWLTEAGHHFQMTHIAIVWLTSVYYATSNAVVGSLRSTDVKSSLLVRRPAVLTAVGLLTVTSGLVAVAATPPWSPCLAAGLVAIAVGSSLASTVSDCVLVARCHARRHYLRTPGGGGLLASVADEDDVEEVDDLGAGNSVTFGGGTQRCHDWLAVMRLGAGGVGMALITVLVDQIMASMTWIKGIQALTGLVSIPVAMAVVLHRSIASTVATPSADRLQTTRHPTADQRSIDVISSTGTAAADDVTSPLRMRIIQLTVLCAAATSFGIYVPFLLLPGDALEYSMSTSSVVLMMVLMGVAYSFGCLLAGVVLISFNRRRPVTSSECVIARRQFCQAASCACAAAIMLFAGAEGFADRALFAGIYGLVAGALQYSLDAFWRERRTSVMTSHAGEGPTPDYIVLAQVVPSLIGPPIVAHLNGIRRGVGYFAAGFVMLIGTASLFFVPCAVTTTTTTTPTVNENGTDDRRQRVGDDDDFHFLPDDQRQNHQRKQDNSVNDVSNNVYFRSPSASGKHVQRDSARTGNRSSPMSVTRDGFHLLKFKSASMSVPAARSGTWPTVAAIPSPLAEVVTRNTEYYDNEIGVNELQSPISAVDKVADFLRRKCTVGGIRSTSAVPFWSRDPTGNDYADRKDNEMRVFVGDRV